MHHMYGPMNWGDMIWNECAMNQRIRIDGSCHTCKKPYVQSQDGRSCEFVGRREYGGITADPTTDPPTWAEAGDRYMGRLNNYKQYGKGYYNWGDSGNDYYGMWLNGQKHGMGMKNWDNGSSYEGEWVEDKMHGEG